ncbi:MAG: hypothetical protein V4685_06990 [Bacteroidota bacterium]
MSKFQKWLLVAKALMVVLYLIQVIVFTPTDNFKLFMGITMVFCWALLFSFDLYDYNKSRKNKT